MSFYRRLKYFLVHTLMHTNKEAQQLITTGRVELNGETVFDNCFLDDTAEIKVNGAIKRPKKNLVYYKFYKPAGYESTLNKNIETNLSVFFKDDTELAIAGRLDKQSEGLLLLSNDGKWVEMLCNPKFDKEKEYLVQLNNTPDEEFVRQFEQGVTIRGYLTEPCQCELLADNTIRVILTEGKNRQIRRMCKKLGYEVLHLKRIRIDQMHLGDLRSGDKIHLTDNELFIHSK